MNKNNWIKVLSEINKTNGVIKPILVEGGTYSFNIHGMKDKMLGYMTIWNEETLSAIQVSRMEIKEGMPFYEMGEEEDLEQPENLIFESML
jgi:hypothetical protein